MKDYYKVLGVPRTATAEQIKQAYRYLVKGCHPDVNKSPQAAEWTRQLNEAYTILSDLQSRASHDRELQAAESKQTQREPRPSTKPETRTEPPKAEPTFCCESCKGINSSLRVSTTWRVYGFFSMSQKSPKTKILCGRCRVKESLAASATTMFLGWWGYVAFVWTLKALYTNAHGGEQHRENNLMLLNALGYQLFKAKRHEEAYRALSASFELSPTPKTREALDSLKPLFHPSQEKPFWERLGDFDLHPGYYHGPAGVVALCLLLLGFAVLKANSTSDTASTAPRPAVSYSQQPVQASPPAQEVSDRRDVRPGIDFKPVFSVPEEPLPNQGVLTLSDRVLFNKSTTAPLEVTTRSSDGHYVMKVQDWDTGEFVAKYFIRRGSTLSIELPLGAYKLKFASGDTWYGAEHLFGPTTSYSFVDEKMVFYQSGDSARGHRLDLIPQVGGNLKTPRMDAADW